MDYNTEISHQGLFPLVLYPIIVLSLEALGISTMFANKDYIAHNGTEKQVNGNSICSLFWSIRDIHFALAFPVPPQVPEGAYLPWGLRSRDGLVKQILYP